MEQLLKALGGKGGAPIQQLASQFGLSEDQAEQAIGKLAPALAGAMGKNASNPGGLAALSGALSSGKHQKYVDDPSSLADPATRDDGNKILGHLLGSKDESRRLAGEASKSTGLDVGILKNMLPLVATMFMGSVGSAGGGGGVDGLGSVLQGFGIPFGGPTGTTGKSGLGGLGSLLGKMLKR